MIEIDDIIQVARDLGWDVGKFDGTYEFTTPVVFGEYFTFEVDADSAPELALAIDCEYEDFDIDSYVKSEIKNGCNWTVKFLLRFAKRTDELLDQLNDAVTDLIREA